MSRHRLRARAHCLRIGLVCAGLIAVAACGSTSATSTPSAATTMPSAAAASTSQSSPASSSPAAELSPEVTVIPLDADFYAIAAGLEGLWLLSSAGRVLQIDQATNHVVADIEVPASEFGYIAVGAGSVWVTNFDHDTLIRIDPATNKVVATIAVGTNPESLLVTADTVWTANHRGGSISKVDVATNTVVATFDFASHGSSGPKGIVMAAGDLWTTVPNMLSVFRLSPTTGSVVARLTLVHDDLDYPMSDGHFVFVPTSDGTFEKIDPATNTVVQHPSPTPIPWLFARSAFWAPSGQDLVRLDPATLEAAERWRLAPASAEPLDVMGMAVDEDAVWLIVAGHTLIRVDVTG
jgi:YVTN family beta-propeller protein